MIFDDRNHEIEIQSPRGLKLLAVHHEAAVAGDDQHAPFGIKQSCHHPGWQTGSHRRQRIVEEKGVCNVGAVVTRKPNLVHPVVERDDSVGRHDLPDVMHDALRSQREAILFRTIGDVIQDILAQRDPIRVHLQLAFQPAGEQVKAFGDVADDFRLRKIHLFDGRRRKPDMNDLMLASGHEERRLLDCVVPDRYDNVRAIDRPVDVIAFAQGRGAEIEVRRTPDSPLPHLCIEEWDADATNEVGKRWRKPRATCSSAEHQQRKLRGQDQVGCALDGFRRGNRNLHRMARHQRGVSRFLLGHVFGQFEMYRAGALFGRDAKRIPDQGWNARCTHDLL